MARHSKWHKVRQFKGAIDAKRSASFTKLAREITVAAREKGADPNMNAALRTAIDRARDASMPKDNIERAIQRGIGGSAEGQIETLTYEGYGPGGTALIIECLTDNRNRTANDVKHLLSKAGGSLAQAGAVTYLFDRIGSAHLPSGLPSECHEELELALIEAGATDIVEHDEGDADVRSTPNDLAKVSETLAKLNLKSDSVGFEWMPKSLVEVDEAIGLAVSELVETLENHDDVSKVSTNMA